MFLRQSEFFKVVDALSSAVASLTARVPQAPNVNSTRLQAIFEEYRAVRNEQLKRSELADRAFHYLVILAAGVVASFFSFYSQDKLPLSLNVLGIAPMVLTPFVFVAIQNEIVLVRLGVYCHRVLRPMVVAAIGHEDVWLWERFHAEESKSLLFRAVGAFRRVAFFTPSLLPTLGYALLHPARYSVVDKWLLGLDIAMTFVTLILLLYGAVVFSRAVDLAVGKPVPRSND